MTLATRLMVLVAAFAVSIAAYAVQQQRDIQVTVNGSHVTFADQSPSMFNGRVLVPVRGVFEHMDATVNWIPEQRKVEARRNGKFVELWIGRTTARVDGQNVQLDVPARIHNGRTLVPLRFLSESLDADVEWRADIQTVVIRTD